jgi:hypothetical protein
VLDQQPYEEVPAMTTPTGAGASRGDAARNFSNLSSQFCEMYRAYTGRPSQAGLRASGYEGPADQAAISALYTALELALKGWNMFCEPGTTEEQLKKRGHKLVGLADIVRARSEVPSDVKRMLASYRRLLGALKRLRYNYPILIDDDSIPTPMPIEPFAEFVSEVGFQLRLACERAA